MSRAAFIALALAASACGQASAQSAHPPAPESLFILPPTLNLAAYNVTEPVKVAPIVNVDDFGAKGDGVTDDTAALNAAAASLTGGGTVVFSPGKIYRKTDLLAINNANVELWGYGAIVFADDINNPSSPNLAIQLLAAHTHAFGLTIVSNLSARPTNTPSAGFYISGDDHLLIDNRIEYTGTCVFNQGTHVFLGRNICYRSWADGFTSAGGVTCACSIGYIIVAGNVAYQNGDDMISIVNYADVDDEAPFITQVYIHHNTVTGNYNGAGVAVHGADSVTIKDNTITQVGCGSGVIVDSTVSFETRNVTNILVTGNVITDTQTITPTYAPQNGCPGFTGVNHGDFYINAAGGHHVTGVLFNANRLERSRRFGAQFQQSGAPPGVVANVGYQGLRMIGMQTTPIQAGTAGIAVCSDNQIVDSAPTTATLCPTAAMPAVTGASYVSR